MSDNDSLLQPSPYPDRPTSTSAGANPSPEQTKVLSEEEIAELWEHYAMDAPPDPNADQRWMTDKSIRHALATIRALQGQVQHLREIKSNEERVPQAVARLDEVLSISNAYPQDAGSWLVVREHMLALQAENAAQAKQIHDLEQEEELSAWVIDKQGKILTGVAEALKGKPKPLHLHSHHDLAELSAAQAKRIEGLVSPIPMLLYCPHCFAQHIDMGDWAEIPHRTHLCANCKQTFRPAHRKTVGVLTLPPIIEDTP